MQIHRRRAGGSENAARLSNLYQQVRPRFPASPLPRLYRQPHRRRNSDQRSPSNPQRLDRLRHLLDSMELEIALLLRQAGLIEDADALVGRPVRLGTGCWQSWGEDSRQSGVRSRVASAQPTFSFERILNQVLTPDSRPTMASTLLFELTDGIARVTVNRPDKLNALNAIVIARAGRRRHPDRDRMRQCAE